MVASLCEEVKQPEKSVPKAMGEHTASSDWTWADTLVLSVLAAAITGIAYLVS
jgi:hypothetical protein